MTLDKSSQRDPVRWSEAAGGAPPELREWLTKAREDVPGPSALAALGIALPPTLAGPIPGSSGGETALATKTAVATGGKVVAGASLGKIASATLVLALGAGGGIWASGVLNTKEVSVATSSATAPDTETLTADPLLDPSSGDATPAADSTSADSDGTEVEQAPGEAASAGPDPEQTRAAAPTKPVSELDLLGRAQRALSSKPRNALALAEQHRRVFPNGKYVQEREVIRIEALRRLGRTGEAETLSEDFGRRFPESAHRSKLGAGSP